MNISSDHIVDGNPKITLGLVWSIIQHWQVCYNNSDCLHYVVLVAAETFQDHLQGLVSLTLIMDNKSTLQTKANEIRKHLVL